MKRLQVSAFGNAILDILVQVSEEVFESLELTKGEMKLVDLETQQGLLAKLGSVDPVLISGGAMTNSMIAFAQLGGKAAFSACIGDDPYGLHYQQELTQLGIELDVPLQFNEKTGTSLIIITPDSERTMCTNLAVAADIDVSHIKEQTILNSEWVALEGYLLSSPTGQALCREVANIAKQNGIKILTTISAGFIASVFKNELQALVEKSDLVMANLDEARVYLGNEDLDVKQALEQLHLVCPEVVLTDGPNGAYGIKDGQIWHVPAVVSNPVDATGAGDMFTGVYLYGICNGYAPEVAAKASCFMAHKVIEQVGARLSDGMPENLFEMTLG